MKILAFSDIHNNIASVRKLCSEVEIDDLDLVIVAGDIGDEITSEFFLLLDRKFSCPIYYSLGNWDADTKYDEIFSPKIFHLHHNMQALAGYNFVGFSGCQANWGNNPYALQLSEEIDNQYKDILFLLEVEKNTIEKKANQTRLKYNELIKIERVKCRDRRKKRYRNKVKRLKELESEEIFKIRLNSCEDSIRYSKEYSKYRSEKNISFKNIQEFNRLGLVDYINKSGVDTEKLIIVTHERFYKLADYSKNPPLINIFGHIHGFKNKNFKGTKFINVSVLDNFSFVTSEQNIYKKYISGNYSIIEISNTGHIEVENKKLGFNEKNWSKVIKSSLYGEDYLHYSKIFDPIDEELNYFKN